MAPTSGLLQGEHSAVCGNLANFLHPTFDGANTVVQISTAGAFTGASDQGTAVLGGAKHVRPGFLLAFESRVLGVTY